MERDTEELIEVLDSDVNRCRKDLLASIDGATRHEDGTASVDYEFLGRMLIRATMAYVEGTSFAVKLWAISKCMDLELELTQEELDGTESRAKLTLKESLRLAFGLLERVHPELPKFNPGGATWWAELMQTIDVRNRLMHPSKPENLDISPDEIFAAIRALDGFKQSILFHAGAKNA